MQNGHQSYLSEIEKAQNERMEVDWVSQPSADDKKSGKTNPFVNPVRDEFSYSLMENIWLKRELLEGED